MSKLDRSFRDDEQGAVAATFAIALSGLVAIAGVGFDYARLVGMDTELQNGADQAALAGASQLDGRAAVGLVPGACARAATAARSLVSNVTLLANDGTSNAITLANETTCDAVGNIMFWQDRDKSIAATSDANANFIEVRVDVRAVQYVFTPIVGAFNSGAIAAAAMAGVGKAICKVPPVMICNPEETNDPTFTVGNYIGKGLRLVTVGGNTTQNGKEVDNYNGSSGAWAPGNFGYLDVPSESNGTPMLREALGWESAPTDCYEYTGVDTEPGAKTSVTGALNTRFDIYEPQSCPSGGTCSPSANAVKDLVKKDGTNGNACGDGPQGWKVSDSPYLPAQNQTLAAQAQALPDAMGHPRDICHAIDSGTTGYCSTPFGNGAWDRDAYFAVNYPAWAGAWQSNTGLSANATRYQVYNWELAHTGQTIGGETVLGTRTVSGTGGNALKARGAPYCSTPGVTPGPATVDRRKLTVAVINCTGNSVNGSATNVPVEKWIDIFLVEPSLQRARTHAGDIYAEVISEATISGNGAAPQSIRRDMPYLVR